MGHMTTQRREIVLDGRRRTSLAKVGVNEDTRYIAETFDDGSILLTPAVTIDKVELAALKDPQIRAALDGALAAKPHELTRRGSFAAYADEAP